MNRKLGLHPIPMLPVIILLLFSCHPQERAINNRLQFESLRCEYQKNPLGIDTQVPRFTWITTEAIKDGFQTAYQVLVSDSPDGLKKDQGNVWNSGKVFSSKSVQVEYQGKKLKSGQRYYWKVRIWDNYDQASAYSEMVWWEMGLLYPDDWKSKWISAPRVFDWAKRDQQRKELSRDAPPEMGEPAPLFRKTINLAGGITNARLYVSGLGYYEVYINGIKVGDQVLDPAFTDYDKTILYETYDPGNYLKQGDNVIGVMLGNGWYHMTSRGVWSFDRAPWLDDPALNLTLRIDYQDGTTRNIISDSTWRCYPGPILFNSIRQGEFYDARLEQTGWSEPGFDDNLWQPVRQVNGATGAFTSQTMPAIRIHDKLRPVSIRPTSENTWLCDFGQNIAGFAELSFTSAGGDRIELKYGEKIHADGTVDQRNINGLVAQFPFQTDIYITRGGEKETWHPRFVYHGFQYIEVSGFPGNLREENISACVVHTTFEKKGNFECSNALLNKIQQNTEWSFVNNYHGYPTDCPHREKNGWTGDAQLACDMALFNYRVEGAYGKWLNDIVDAQLESGMIPAIVPTGGWGYHWGNGPAWDFALFILPWNMYVHSGDRQVLEKYYPAIKRYLAFLTGTTDDLVIRWGLGDWVPARTVTPPELITTAYFYQQALIASKIAGILGFLEDRNTYLDLARDIRMTFQKHFVLNQSPWIGNGSQTSLGCALYFSLLDSATTEKALQELIRNIKGSDMNLDFGVLGSKFVPNALAENEKYEVAYQLINTTDYPGWGNWVKRGATTLWEDWRGESSLNHVFFGDVSAWFYKYLAGIRPDENQPGFKHFYIAPNFPEDLEWVKAHVDSYHGRIESRWEKEKERIRLSVRIPFNTSATIRLKTVEMLSVRESGSDAELTPEISVSDDLFQEMILGAGNYQILLGK